MAAVADLSGMTFGRLFVVCRSGMTDAGKAEWWCRCDCGAEHVAVGGNLTSGGTKSCGCLSRKLTAERASKRNWKHGHSAKVGGRVSLTPEYRIWAAMKARCKYPGVRSYHNYGGRGIRVCERWESSFEAFLQDMGPKPSSRHSIDRIDVNGNYEPDNCRWATWEEQARNRRPRGPEKGWVAPA